MMIYRISKRVEDLSEDEVRMILEARMEPDEDYSLYDIPEIEGDE